MSWSAGEGVKGSLGGFLVDLARNTLRAERHSLTFTHPYIFPLTCFAGQGGSEHIQICLEGAQAMLARPVPVWWQAAEHLPTWSMSWVCWPRNIQEQKREMAPGSCGPASALVQLLSFCRESGWEQVQEGLCPHALTFPTGLCVQVFQHMASPSF